MVEPGGGGFLGEVAAAKAADEEESSEIDCNPSIPVLPMAAEDWATGEEFD